MAVTTQTFLLVKLHKLHIKKIEQDCNAAQFWSIFMALFKGKVQKKKEKKTNKC